MVDIVGAVVEQARSWKIEKFCIEDGVSVA